jgi:hypothetical protein
MIAAGKLTLIGRVGFFCLCLLVNPLQATNNEKEVGSIVASLLLQQAMIHGDWKVVASMQPQRFFDIWPESSAQSAALPLQFFFSGALIFPREPGEIAFYNPWLDSALIARWEIDSKNSGPNLVSLVPLSEKAEVAPRWLDSSAHPLLSITNTVATFAGSWDKKGLNLTHPRAYPHVFIERCRLHLAHLIGAHDLILLHHPELHRELRNREVGIWAARLPETVADLKHRFLDLESTVLEQLVLGGAWPLDDSGRLLLALWPESLPQLAVMLIYNPETESGLTDLVYLDLLEQLEVEP